MSREKRTVEAVRDEILAAVAELRAVALSEQDQQRTHVADRLDAQFTGVSDRRALREAARGALTLYQGGSGSFRDVGSEASSHAVNRLHGALRRGRSWFLRNS